jgi:hypothetical protein
MKDSKIACSWRIQTMVDNLISKENILHDIISNNKSYRFICNIKKANCESYLNKIISKANNIVYNDLQQFDVLTDPEESCIIFSGGVYRFSIFVEHRDILSDPKNFKIIE